MNGSTETNIGIIGAGPGGLVAARILAMHGRNVTLLEREGAFSERTQGGSLDIHEDAGQVALAKAGLMDEFRKIARYADQEMRLYDMQGVLRFADTEVEGKTRPETDRGHLRKVLLDSLPEGVVRWGAKVVEVEALEDGGCEVISADGHRERFDLVVGADGTWSKVRPVLSKAIPAYSGILMLEFGIDDADRRYPDTAAMAGHGLTFAIGNSKAIVAHRHANAHLGGYLGMRAPADWFEQEGLSGMSEAAVRERLCAEFSGWGEPLLLWIKRSNGPISPRPIYELPVGHRWEHREGVTLLGDAAHVMSPFGGDGANLALVDGANLAEALLQDDWRTAVRDFERTMCDRAEEPARGASAAIQEVFSPQGLEHSLQWVPVREALSA